jgi:hypothetical protein
MALSKNDEYQRARTDPQRTDASALKSTGETLNLVTDVMIGAAVLAAAGTTYFHFEGLKGPADERTHTAVQLQSAVSPTGVWMGLNGRF